MNKMKSLAKDTAIYGVSSILGRFLNWLLVPLYTFVLKDPAEYGIITNLYAWTALIMVVLTYGMETGFFRFINKEKDPKLVYGSTLLTLGFTSLLFSIGIILFAQPIADMMGYAQYPEYVWILGVVVALDAFGTIPFAYLRYKNRPIRFAALKLIMIIANIVFNIFFLVVCPWLMKVAPSTVNWFFDPNYGVGYIIWSNLASTAISNISLIPDMMEATYKFSKELVKRMLQYSLPLLILGVAGIMNQTVDKIIFPMVYPDKVEGMHLLGVYGACFKIAMVMMMFTQAFRYAYEPFVFAQHKDKNSKEAYADAMKLFVIFSFLIFLGMVFYLDVLKYIIGKSYWGGLKVVPVILLSYLFQGIYFNLSLWYKLTDKTMFGAIFSTIGFSTSLAINIIFIPIYGYWASAWGAFFSYLFIMLLSYFFGQKYFPINYKLKEIGKYALLSGVLYGLSIVSDIFVDITILKYLIKTLLLGVFIYYVIKKDLPLKQIPFINRYIK